MRLWHQALIHHLPNKQLLGQHRECCALRGKGWGKKHSVVDYVFKHSRALLYAYHCCVMNEMEKRGYKVTYEWNSHFYRGKSIGKVADDGKMISDFERLHAEDPGWKKIYANKKIIYPEHDDKYLRECLLNLQAKGAELINGASIEEMLLRLEVKLLGDK